MKNIFLFLVLFFVLTAFRGSGFSPESTAPGFHPRPIGHPLQRGTEKFLETPTPSISRFPLKTPRGASDLHGRTDSANNVDYTNYVNPFVGTGGHGHTFPGATVPFGMVQLSPDTRLEGWDGCSGYHYSDNIIWGFSHTHLSGTGVPDYCDILFMPFVEEKNIDIDKSVTGYYASQFDHSEESAEPGYYSVMLKRGNIKAELTASTRAGFHKYTFPTNENSKVFIDLKHRDAVIESHLKIISKNEISGFRRSNAWARDQRVYFYAVFSEPFNYADVYLDDKRTEEQNYTEGKNVKTLLDFSNIGKPLYVKVGISSVSEENAKMNLESEIKHWDFEKTRADAKQMWNDYLGKIEVKSDNVKKLRTFYTALYHTAICPNTFNDADGSYLGRDLKPHKADHGYYTVFSLWDTYRALHPLLNIIERKRTADFIKTFILQYEQGGRLPVWELGANETDCMIGYHSIPVISDAYISGIKDFDTKKALDAMVNSSNLDIYGLNYYRSYGYIPADKEHESVSKTLEYAFDDWCIEEYIRNAGFNDNDFPSLYEKYSERSKFYKNIFDPSTGFMRPRINGGWKDPFLPTDVDNNYTEANAWQYSFYVPQNIEDLNTMLGGKLEEKLDGLFNADTKTTGREQSDITGLIGQYAHGNEPSHHIAYLYNFTSSPWKTQKMVHKIMEEFYTDEPDGLIGNEDCGQMSAWYVLSAMGLYPVTPGSGKFTIGSPLFKEVKVHLENGKTFTVHANGLSEKNIYISAINRNDKSPFVSYEEILNGAEIQFKMSDTPANIWDLPVSQIRPGRNFLTSPVTDKSWLTFRNKLEVKLTDGGMNTSIYYTLDGSEPYEKSLKYTKPVVIDKTTTIKSISITEDGRKSYVTESNYYKLPDGVKVNLISVPGASYTAGGPEALADGIRGTTEWRLGRWQGYQGQDFSAVVEFDKVREISGVGAGFLQDTRSWIWMPVYAEFEVSTDGVNYTKVCRIENIVADTDQNTQIKNFEQSIKPVKAKYIRMFAKNYGKIPAWHLGAGYDAYIFIDEITYK